MSFASLTNPPGHDKIKGMNFVTIHDLSRELDVSARVIRYHLTQLIAAGKLTKDEDYRKEDYKDPLHFEWKINADSFIRESGLTPKSPISKIDADLVNDSIRTGDNTVNEPITKSVPRVSEHLMAVTKPPEPVNESVDQSKTIISLHREMIVTLKEQVQVKDEQIRELTKQNRDSSELNLKLNSALLKQGSEIKNLLQLTGGKMEVGDVVNHHPTTVNTTVNQNSTIDNNAGDGFESNQPSETAMAA